MFRQLLHTVILLSALTPVIVQPFVYVEYQMRKDYIVAELCKDRYATVNTCDGRCFLVDRWNETQQRESEEKERNIKPVEIKLHLLQKIGELDKPAAGLLIKSSIGYTPRFYSYLAIESIDEPPKV